MKKTLFFIILLLGIFALSAEQIVVSQYPDELRLVNGNPTNMELEFTLGSFYREPVTINGELWYNLNLRKRITSGSSFSKELNYSFHCSYAA